MTRGPLPEYETRIFSLSAIPDRQNEDIARIERDGWELDHVIPNANAAVFRRRTNSHA